MLFLAATSWRYEEFLGTRSVDLLEAGMPVCEVPWLPVSSTAVGFPCSNKEKHKKTSVRTECSSQILYSISKDTHTKNEKDLNSERLGKAKTEWGYDCLL